MPRKLTAPVHLSASTRRWWSSIAAEFAMESHHLRLLTLAGEAWDWGQQAREIIATEGPVYRDRFGAPRAHPAVAIERDARVAFCRCLRELELSDESEPEPAERAPRRRRS